MFYIYKITNIINNKIYIGQTNNPKRRWIKHKVIARGGEKYEDFYYLHRSMRKHGIDNFTFEVVSSFNTLSEVLAEEVKLIDQYNTKNSLYGMNLSIGGEGNTGYHHTEEFKKRLSMLKKGQPGRKCPEEEKKMRSLMYSGKNNPFYGKHHTEETRNKLSQMNIGKTIPDNIKNIIREKSQGEKGNNAKLYNTIVLDIRQRVSNGEKQSILAKEYGISKTTVGDIIKRRSWKHI